MVHDLLAHLAEVMLEMNKQKLARRSGLLGWRASSVPGSMISRQRTKLQSYYEHVLRGLFGGAQEEPEEADHRSCPPGDGRSHQCRVRGVDGQDTGHFGRRLTG